MATATFLVHASRPDAAALAETAAAWLRQRGHRARILRLRPPDLVAEEAQDQPLDHVDLSGCDLAVSVGGDGTFLRLVPLAAAAGVPVLGVNFGRLGYLLEVQPAAVLDALARFLAGDLDIQERVLVSATVDGHVEPLHPAAEVEPPPPPVGGWLALNEVAVEKTLPGHTIHLETSVDGELLHRLRADGVLVATPTGSTAYNLSAGGPALAPELQALVVTPVAPHLAVPCSVVLEDHRRVSLEVAAHRPAALVIDGRPAGRLSPGTVVHCVVAPQRFCLLTLGRRPLASALRTVLAQPGSG